MEHPRRILSTLVVESVAEDDNSTHGPPWATISQHVRCRSERGSRHTSGWSMSTGEWRREQLVAQTFCLRKVKNRRCISPFEISEHRSLRFTSTSSPFGNMGSGGRSSVATPGVRCSTWTPGPVEWFKVNDVVMGGRSTSELACDAEGRLVFTGIINTNGGGFASLRTPDTCRVTIPAGTRHAKVVAEGDGQMYKLTFGTDASRRGPTWSYDFLTTKGSVQEFVLPLNGFVAGFRGMPVQGVLNPSDIQNVGIMLSLKTSDGRPNPHFGDGPFKLTLHEVSFQ